MSYPSGQSQGRFKLSVGDAARLTEQIAALSEAGLPLASGLRALGEELRPGRLRRVLERLSSTLEAGASLEAALDAEGGHLPAQLRGLVLAGARTGRLGEVLARFAGYASVGADLRGSLSLRLVYPAFALSFAAGLFLFVCVVLMSGFEKIFQDFGMPLPVLTRLVFRVTHAVGESWWPFLQGAGVLVALWLVANLLPGSPWRRGLISALPLIGPVWRLTSLAEFSHLLALLLESEVPLVEALPMAGEGVGDVAIAASSAVAARAVAGGQSLVEALATRDLFPRGFARILGWAETHRGLPEALHMAGEMFEARARSQANFVSTLCSVLVVLSILGGVALVVVAILAPMIGLITRLSG